MTNQITPEGYYTEDQMAQLLGKAKGTLKVDHSRRSHRVPPKTKVGNLILYSKESFDAWLKTKEVNFDKKIRRWR